jgi:hypothetical protein
VEDRRDAIRIEAAQHDQAEHGDHSSPSDQVREAASREERLEQERRQLLASLASGGRGSR